MAAAPIRAAGVVLLNDAGQAAVVHRYRRDDWSLPKGKLESGEYSIDAAIRETREETGIDVTLMSRLPTAKYTVAGYAKEVDYWVARVRLDHGFVAGSETDELRWIDLAEAPTLLTYPPDIARIELAKAHPPTSPLILLRHATAMKRVDWAGEDSARPLRPEGLVEADRLVSQLIAFGIESLRSSDAERCLATVAALSTVTGLNVIPEPGLSETGFETDPPAAPARILQLLADQAPTVVCTHRPILPELLRQLVAATQADPTLAALDPRIPPGAFIVLHRAFEAESVRLISAEVHLPRQLWHC